MASHIGNREIQDLIVAQNFDALDRMLDQGEINEGDVLQAAQTILANNRELPSVSSPSVSGSSVKSFFQRLKNKVTSKQHHPSIQRAFDRALKSHDIKMKGTDRLDPAHQELAKYVDLETAHNIGSITAKKGLLQFSKSAFGTRGFTTHSRPLDKRDDKGELVRDDKGNPVQEERIKELLLAEDADDEFLNFNYVVIVQSSSYEGQGTVFAGIPKSMEEKDGQISLVLENCASNKEDHEQGRTTTVTFPRNHDDTAGQFTTVFLLGGDSGRGSASKAAQE